MTHLAQTLSLAMETLCLGSNKYGILVFFVRSRNFKCSLEYAKRSCYRSINAIFDKVGRIASEEVILQLVSKQCVPILLYGLEACPLTVSDKKIA